MRRVESVIIVAGSTTYCLAEFLEGMSLDILTSSFPLASHLVAQSRNRITLPGGPVYREQGIVLSPFESDVARHFRGERMFTSCYGLNRFGLMENDPLIVQSQIRLMASAETVVVLADSRKLRQQSSMIVVEPGRIGTLITDWEARPEELEPFRALGIEIIQAEPGQEDGIRRVA